MADVRRYRVWDSASSEAHAYECEAHTAEHAAEMYAEDDVDGQGTGDYWKPEGHTVHVRCPDGTTRRCIVNATTHHIAELHPDETPEPEDERA